MGRFPLWRFRVPQEKRDQRMCVFSQTSCCWPQKRNSFPVIKGSLTGNPSIFGKKKSRFLQWDSNCRKKSPSKGSQRACLGTTTTHLSQPKTLEMLRSWRSAYLQILRFIWSLGFNPALIWWSFQVSKLEMLKNTLGRANASQLPNLPPA